jgi:hypothetical protein
VHTCLLGRKWRATDRCGFWPQETEKLGAVPSLSLPFPRLRLHARNLMAKEMAKRGGTGATTRHRTIICEPLLKRHIREL